MRKVARSQNVVANTYHPFLAFSNCMVHCENQRRLHLHARTIHCSNSVSKKVENDIVIEKGIDKYEYQPFSRKTREQKSSKCVVKRRAANLVSNIRICFSTGTFPVTGGLLFVVHVIDVVHIINV